MIKQICAFQLFRARKTVICFSLLAIFWQCHAAAPGAIGEAEAPIAVQQRKMGIEIETSSIKINNPNDDKVGFTFQHPVDRPVIILEEDTLDGTFRGSDKLGGFDRNLECKTVGGFEREELTEVAKDMHSLLGRIYSSCRGKNFTVNIEWLQRLYSRYTIASRSTHPFVVIAKPVRRRLEPPPSGAAAADEPKIDGVPGAAILVTAPTDDSIIRPQVTYQLPLEEIPGLFLRLQELGHKGIQDFLAALSPSDEGPAYQDIGRLREVLKEKDAGFFDNMERQQDITRFFRATVFPIFTGTMTDKVRGFNLLFLYYWFELFNNKAWIDSKHEPGVKQFLGIMSRLPFSQLYDSLDDAEKGELNGILRPLVGEHGAKFRLRSYEDYDENAVQPTLTVQEWYQSIIDTATHGQTVEERQVDKLSPPPDLDPAFDSMGALDRERDAQGLALIEVRGYANLPLMDRPMSITDLPVFIARESNWFFEEAR
jgi:hypothetical protein